MHRLAWMAAGLVATTLSVYVFWLTELPLGIPGEWTWPRLPRDDISLGNLQLAWICGGGYVAFVLFGGRRLARTTIHRAELAGWLCGLMAVAAFWLWQVQDSAPTAGQWAKAPFVLYYPSSSGYFYKARYDGQPVGKFLTEYETLMSERDVLHVGTHPPGLFLVFYGLIDLSDRYPGLLQTLQPTMPETFRDAFAIVRENTSRTIHPTVPADELILWLATASVLICAVGTVLPLYGLLRRTLDRRMAWFGAALWPLVPAVAIFQPKSDVVYPCLATLFVWLSWSAWRQTSWWRAALAGLTLWCGLMCSLALLPVLLFMGLLIATDFLHKRPHGRQAALWISGLALGFVIPCVVLYMLSGIVMPRIWWWNYHNHAGFYAQYPRTWWKWLLVNPIELGCAVGWPLLLLAVCGGLQNLRAGSGRTMLRDATLIGAGVWSLLWITGKNSGEAARLWLVIMPGVVWLAAHGLAWAPANLDSSRFRPWHWWCFWLLLQMGAAACTIHRIGGFHLSAPS
ncbi:hypothetical protein GC163_20070 [bacterium]|nr:hypothetical protein [bacterium]